MLRPSHPSIRFAKIDGQASWEAAVGGLQGTPRHFFRLGYRYSGEALPNL